MKTRILPVIGRPCPKFMLIPLRPGELPRLIPAVATGPQFNACSGNAR